MALVWQMNRLLPNLPNLRFVLTNSTNQLSAFFKLQLNLFAVRSFLQTILRVVTLTDTRVETGMNVMTDVIVSIVDTRLRLPTEALLKGIQAGMQLEIYYEWLGQARH